MTLNCPVAAVQWLFSRADENLANASPTWIGSRPPGAAPRRTLASSGEA
jgi:hypothetical protein